MATCPICKRHQAEEKYKPFCSRRCADVDLGRWFTGSYAIPVRDDEPTDEEGGPGEGARTLSPRSFEED
ncbi:MAG: DNA gyrase inhibitor YacG [Caulobacteraceae bacterium]|nr:DNA gyrase inhibitor YacG [Caulobacteraceae bacterium]